MRENFRKNILENSEDDAKGKTLPFEIDVREGSFTHIPVGNGEADLIE